MLENSIEDKVEFRNFYYKDVWNIPIYFIKKQWKLIFMQIWIQFDTILLFKQSILRKSSGLII